MSKIESRCEFHGLPTASEQFDVFKYSVIASENAGGEMKAPLDFSCLRYRDLDLVDPRLPRSHPPAPAPAMAQTTLNSETGSLVTTYLILIVLLISLWILYAGIL